MPKSRAAIRGRRIAHALARRSRVILPGGKSMAKTTSGIAQKAGKAQKAVKSR